MKEKFSNFIDYVHWRGDLTFDESPFCEVDALIFSQIAYLNLSHIVGKSFSQPITISQVAEEYKRTHLIRARLGALISIDVQNLLYECAKSKRFGDVKMCGYVIGFDKEIPIQFSAETFILNNAEKEVVVSYEGTDDSFAGWHEDFTISYEPDYPSLPRSLEYFNNVTKVIKGNFIIVGHSKGGSNGVYAAIYADAKAKKKLKAVYNFDGPGFTKKVIQSPEYASVKDRIFSYYPQFSVVGMVLYQNSKYKIVHSEEKLLMQHDPCSWGVMGNHLVYEEGFAEESKFVAKSVNDWIDNTPYETKKMFSDTLFGLLDSSGVNSNLELEENMVTISAKMISAYAKLTSEQKKVIQDNIHGIIEIGKSNLPMIKIFQFKK